MSKLHRLSYKKWPAFLSHVLFNIHESTICFCGLLRQTSTTKIQYCGNSRTDFWHPNFDAMHEKNSKMMMSGQKIEIPLLGLPLMLRSKENSPRKIRLWYLQTSKFWKQYNTLNSFFWLFWLYKEIFHQQNILTSTPLPSHLAANSDIRIYFYFNKKFPYYTFLG